MTRHLRVLHFNDVYHAGAHNGRTERAARFLAAAEPYLQGSPPPLVVCCGDVLAPSLMSTTTRGLHMMETMELLGVHVGTLGNHDFDFGIDRLKDLLHTPCLVDGTTANTTQWVMSNIHARGGAPIAGCHETVLMDWHGVKVGLIGVSENWLAEAGLSNAKNAGEDKFAEWTCDVAAAGRHAEALKGAGADVVIVMCHSLVKHTKPLAAHPHVDFVLGGHEHISAPQDPAAARWVISGWDFEEFSILDFVLEGKRGPAPLPVTVTRVAVMADQPLPDEGCGSVQMQTLRRLMRGYEAHLAKVVEEEVGATAVALQGKKFMLRTQETNLGSFLADAAREAVGADCALLIGGIISGHAVLPAGPICMKHVLGWFPWEGNAVLLELCGATLLEALEHGVALLPRREGRFPQVSGMDFDVDFRKPAGARIANLRLGGNPVARDAVYSVATNDYVAAGGDGYTMLLTARRLVTPEHGPLLHDVARSYVAKRCEGGAAVAPVVEGRIRHVAGFTIDAAEAAGRRYVGAWGKGHDTDAQDMSGVAS